MLLKLFSLLAASKGGALAAATLVAGARTVSVMTTSPEVQDAVSTLSGVVSSPGMSQLAKADRIHDDCEGGQPVVVAQRNAADKLLRAHHQDEHKRLIDLRDGKDTDHQKANEILRKADRELSGALRQALNDIAAQTLGREGQLKATPTATATPTANPTCTPKPSATPTATPTGTPAGSPSPEVRGREAVAARVTPNATLQGIADEAKADMTEIVDKAVADVAALPAAEHGKSGEHGKPGATTQERGKSSRPFPGRP